MSTITREFTKEQLQHIIETDHVQCGEASALARIALASLEAEPVLRFDAETYREILESIVDERDDEIEIGQLGGNNWLALSKAAYDACRAAMLQGAEPVTTAGKLPFEQWLSQQTGTIDVECGCVMTEVFFHWLRVAYEAGNSPVIPDCWVACSERMPEQFKAILAFNEYGEVWSGAYDRYWNFYCDNLLVEHVTHWMPLPAAPHQEVKP